MDKTNESVELRCDAHKREYQQPVLQLHGSVSELTRGNGGTIVDGNMSMGMA